VEVNHVVWPRARVRCNVCVLRGTKYILLLVHTYFVVQSMEPGGIARESLELK
jgi:hypothetical protein